MRHTRTIEKQCTFLLKCDHWMLIWPLWLVWTTAFLLCCVDLQNKSHCLTQFALNELVQLMLEYTDRSLIYNENKQMLQTLECEMQHVEFLLWSVLLQDIWGGPPPPPDFLFSSYTTVNTSCTFTIVTWLAGGFTCLFSDSKSLFKSHKSFICWIFTLQTKQNRISLSENE